MTNVSYTLKELDNAYYNEDAPLLSDEEYDKLKRKLGKDGVGSPVKTGQLKLKHPSAMLSLSNVFSIEEVLEFVKKVDDEVVTELKFDGVSLNLVYENGSLLEGITRGDGEVGQDVTANVKVIEGVPMNLGVSDATEGILEIRGEVMILLEDFDRVNAEAIIKGRTPYVSPRNLASGSLKLTDIEEVIKRRLVFFPYVLVGNARALPATHFERMELCKLLGFGLAGMSTLLVEDNIEGVIADITENRNDGGFEIDGVVIKANVIATQNKMGATNKEPRWATAFKFPAQEKQTILKDVIFQVSKHGIITPVGLIDPVELGGVTVSRTTLHNKDEIARLGVKIGDLVLMKRAGDVIPKMTTVLQTFDASKEICLPKTCPSCDGEVSDIEGDVYLRCLNNSTCPAQALQTMVHYVSRDAMDIDGVGEKLIGQLVDGGLAYNACDLYTLTKEQLLTLDRMGETKATKILREIEHSKSNPLNRYLYALCIPEVGRTVSRLLAKTYGSLDEVIRATYDDLIKLPDVGNVIAGRIVGYFTSTEGREYVNSLRKLGVIPPLEKLKASVVETNGKLLGKKVVVTGGGGLWSTKDLHQILHDQGAVITTSVTTKTDFLITGNSPGKSKLNKATKINLSNPGSVKVINSFDLLEILKDRRET